MRSSSSSTGLSIIPSKQERRQESQLEGKLEELLKTQPALWRGRDQHNDYASVPTGYPQLDNALPSGGWAVGCLTELLLEQHGIGELSLLLPGLQHVTADSQSFKDQSSGNQSSGGQSLGNQSFRGQWAAFVNPPYLPYAPALANAGVNLERLLIVNTDNDNDTLWATEQLLRAGIFAAVVGWVNRTSAQKQRRLQLAAELGKTWATIYRPASAQDQHSPAALRMVVGLSNHHSHNAAQHLSLNIIKSRGGKQRRVYINPNQFDRPQGAQWPAMPTSATTTDKITASPIIRAL